LVGEVTRLGALGMRSRLLRRYWFEFEAGDLPPGVALGCGVTAYSDDDARTLLAATVFRGASLPSVRRMLSDVDVSTLDADHVLPNMLEPATRGIWFPMGFR
jgi:hypothetical protein